MSWLNPAAFLGLFALAIPILVHLFGRRVARRQRFPSLRLLRDAKATPATRSRPSDLLLLMLRCLVIVAAVAALAQPRWSDTGTGAQVRAILVDTSASMLRLTNEGTTALQQARTIAQAMVDSASEALVVESERPAGSIAAAGSWLARRAGMREVVMISDFQSGAVNDGHLAALAPGIGIRFIRVSAVGAVAASDTVDGIRIEASADRTTATWVSSGSDATSVTVLAADEDQQALRASVAAGRSVAPRVARSANRVTVVFPGAPTWRELEGRLAPLDSAWQGDLVLALTRDPVLVSVAEGATVVRSCEARGAVVVTNAMDEAIASVARTASEVLVFACVAPGSLAATALIAGVESALAGPPVMQELEPTFLPDETMRRWERPAVESQPNGPGDTSRDGRWFWVVALAFLLAEEWVRRRTPRRESPRVNEVPNERVA